MTEGAKVLPFPKRERSEEELQQELDALKNEWSANDIGDPQLDFSVEPLRRRPRIGGAETSQPPAEFEWHVETLFDDMLGLGKIQVYLDPRGADVVVPQEFKSDSVLVLNFSKLFRPGDVYADKKGVGQTLSFQGKQFKCFVPYLSMLAVLQPKSNTMLIFSDRVMQILGPEMQKVISQIEGPFTINPSPKLVEEKGNAEEHEEADDAG